MSVSVKVVGKEYESHVPDTLDLAERAKVGINALTGTVDPEYDYEIYFKGYLCSNPPYLFHETTGMPTNNPKYVEALAMMRVMSGSNQDLEIEEGMMNAILSRIDKDGLYYVSAKGRPWHEGVGHVYPTTNENFANVYGNARAVLAMMAWYQRDGDNDWKSRIQKMVEGLAKIAIYKDDYAYYPDGKVGEAFSYPASGWKDTEEPMTENVGAEGSMFMYYCGVIQAMSQWYAMTGDEKSLQLVKKVVNFVLKPRFWGYKGDYKWIASGERAHWQGHFPAHTHLLRALLDYAIVTNNRHIKEFVRNGYEYIRTMGIPRIGYFGAGPSENPSLVESCATARVVGLALKLCDAGIGDYWEDIDQYIRNHATEGQLVDADLVTKLSGTGPKHNVTPPQENNERVIQRVLGGFGTPVGPTMLPSPIVAGCCTAQGLIALYYAWESIVRYTNGIAQVNLLLNRASPWVDIDSYLPHEGKVVLKNKTAKKIYVRISNWINKQSVRCHLNDKEISLTWLNNYLIFEYLKEGDIITIEFPVVEETAKYTYYTDEYTCHFRGNTLVDIQPRGGNIEKSAIKDQVYPGGSYPLYQREHYEKDKAPMKKTKRFISPVVIKW